jgi:hypothetical protein
MSKIYHSQRGFWNAFLSSRNCIFNEKVCADVAIFIGIPWAIWHYPLVDYPDIHYSTIAVTVVVIVFLWGQKRCRSLNMFELTPSVFTPKCVNYTIHFNNYVTYTRH